MMILRSKFLSLSVSMVLIGGVANPAFGHKVPKESIVSDVQQSPSNSESDLSKPYHVDPKFRARIAKAKRGVILALGGGGCKAVAEIGVLRSLEKNGIPVAGVIGTSMGATIGSMYCAGVPLDEIEQMFLDGTVQRKLKPHIILCTVTRPLQLLLGKMHSKIAFGGLMQGRGYLRLLADKLPQRFSDLKIPFAAVTTDLTDGYTYVMAHGSLPRAVLASSAFPPVLSPVLIDNKLYLDGGLKANLPTIIAQDVCPNVVVGVTVDQSIKPVCNQDLTSMSSVIKRVADIMLAAADKQAARSSDVLIYPNCDHVPLICKDVDVLKKAIAAGEKETDRLLPAINKQVAESTSAERVK